jgi:hypothetical protein
MGIGSDDLLRNRGVFGGANAHSARSQASVIHRLWNAESANPAARHDLSLSDRAHPARPLEVPMAMKESEEKRLQFSTATPQFPRTPVPTSCPWGNIECAAEIAPGWWSVTTASHGGFVLSTERLAAMPPEHLSRTFGSQGLFGYFEENCDWSIVAIAFPEEWRAFVVDRLREPDLVDVAPRLFEMWILPESTAVGAAAPADRGRSPPKETLR